MGRAIDAGGPSTAGLAALEPHLRSHGEFLPSIV
jgi:hypothetical protein